MFFPHELCASASAFNDVDYHTVQHTASRGDAVYLLRARSLPEYPKRSGTVEYYTPELAALDCSWPDHQLDHGRIKNDGVSKCFGQSLGTVSRTYSGHCIASAMVLSDTNYGV